ncbi:t-SNARE domain-containing protein 1-like isoform X2 [Haliotis rubra]|uniref:t-SNARE domain-containing protein 1-like isoform X2 n=1 Tax=Haliotis rubra TaxID=36100 RepID=UPI001EE607F7|nr:t-SNARE domain-containing protein 1-like isoform X2 [Haliotis rubra]
MSSSSEMATAEKKARKVNWTRNEMDCLVDEVEKHKSILFSSFSSVVTNSKKQQIWKDISNRVSACGSSIRSSEDVKKKWTTLKSDTRRKAGSLKKAIFQTGGGPSPSPLSDFEYKVVSLIPSAQINGCTGGLDSEDLSGIHPLS